MPALKRFRPLEDGKQATCLQLGVGKGGSDVLLSGESRHLGAEIVYALHDERAPAEPLRGERQSEKRRTRGELAHANDSRFIRDHAAVVDLVNQAAVPPYGGGQLAEGYIAGPPRVVRPPPVRRGVGTAAPSLSACVPRR